VLIILRFTDPHSHCHVAKGIKNKGPVSCQSLAHTSREIVLSLLRRFWSWLLPPRRNPFLPCSGLEVAAVLLLTELVWAGLLVGPLAQAGLATWQDAIDSSSAQEHGEVGDKLGKANSDAPEEAGKGQLSRARVGLWTSVFCFPLNVATLLLLPRLLSDTQPFQLGLTTYRLGRSVFLAVLGWILLTPLVLWLNVLVHQLYVRIAGGEPALHSLTMLSRSNPAWWELALVVFAAMVAAPIWEELLFRGLLQRWFSQRWWGGALACGLAVAWALVNKSPLILSACSVQDWHVLGVALQPAGFVLLLTPGLLVGSLFRRPYAGRAIYGTAVLFAIRHCESWPDPVALFVLALGLGWLADRTRSLVGPIVLHSLFNGVACVLMFH
jgi:membrane protease YdiL (CAAX protease family)